MDDVTWTALTLTLTAIFAAFTWFAYQRRGLGAGLKGAGITLLPAAALLTDTLQMFTRIVTAVGDWATGLAFSPLVWIGVVLAGLGVLLFGAGRAIDARRRPKEVTAGAAAPRRTAAKSPAKVGSAGGSADHADGELDEIEALLRKRGIT